jgi:hypothetical protein
MYDVFIRTWWKYEYKNGNQVKVPHVGRKSFIARRVLLERARQLCEDYNNSHNPGPLSRKAEFESV